MKNFLILLVLTMQSLLLFSQATKTIRLGVNGGITYSNFTGKTDILGKSHYDFGYETGLCMEMYLNPKWSIETNFNFYQNRSYQDFSIPFEIPGLTNAKSYWGGKYVASQNYFNNSWLIGYDFRDKLTLTIQGGLYWALYLQTKTKGTSFQFIDPSEVTIINDPVFTEGYHETTFSNTYYNSMMTKIDPGLVAGIKMTYILSHNLRITCSPRYYRGIANIFNSEAKDYNNSFNVNFGLIYSI